jgi:integrase
MISDVRIPADRQLVYAFGLLAGMRPGEVAALRWRHYDASAEPLGRLLVATAYNTKRNITKGTKTETTKTIPVHPTLAAMLAEWRLSGGRR